MKKWREVNNTGTEVFSTRESILTDISQIYANEKTGIIKFSKLKCIKSQLKRELHLPRKKIIVLLVGGHSTGKSSFINWFFNDQIQKVSAAIETSYITFVTTGRRQERCDGHATIQIYDFLKEESKIPHFVDNLRTEIRLPVESRSSCVTFIDTPGLIPDENRLSYPVCDSLISLAEHAQIIACFMDPIGQAFSPPLLRFIQEADKKYPQKLLFFLSKSDSFKEGFLVRNPKDVMDDKMRVISSISQKLTNFVKKRTIEVRPLHIPTDYDDPDDDNQIGHLCEVIEKNVQNTFQVSISQLEKDIKDLDIATSAALKIMNKRKRIFKVFLIIFIFFISWYYAATNIDMIVFNKAIWPGLLISGFLTFVFFLLKPSRKVYKEVNGYLSSTSKSTKVKLDEFYQYINQGLI